MSNVGQKERVTQNRVIKLFQQLNYTYLGNWETRPNNRNIEATLLTAWLQKQGITDTLITKALRELDQAATLKEGQNLYDANKAVYRLLRYGIKVKEGAGQQNQTIWLIDWEDPENNDFAIAEEVTVQGEHKKRPDLVLYINGIALGILELKRSSVSIGEGIRQNLDNQKKTFIRSFFTTMQLVMAGNDTQGLRYGTIETPEKYYLTWKEENPNYNPQADPKAQKYLSGSTCEQSDNPLDCALSRLCNRSRFLEIIHDFIVFDSGIKKTCRHNQYFAIKAAQQFIPQQQGGIIWHTQGSGKSLTMVWLAKWIREHLTDARVLIITDRTELDEQIEKVFLGVDEEIYRTQSGDDLITKLNQTTPWLLCSLIHKFGIDNTEKAIAAFIQDLERNIPKNFTPKGNLFVFVDECHRTQSGKLHTAMKTLLPKAVFIGFTGTPLLRDDKQRSIETFDRYLHTYKFDEAVADGVVLDLRYEARDIDQHLTSQQKIDQWFEAKTRGLSELAKTQLKQKWGTMQKVLSSQSRLDQIVKDILFDMDTKPRLMDGRGNAMLVCSSIYQACKVYELLSKTELAGKCAIVTSYKPARSDIKGEESGEGYTEKLNQYAIYRRMLADYFNESEDQAMSRVEEFEKQVKDRFIKEPGQMRLLIVVDKLLTGFDAPSATYLYIDKQMRDHGLFQAICRVNRLDGDDKEYGYIVDYKDLFKRLEGAITDYTSGALDGYDPEDVAGLLSDRLEKSRDRLEETLEIVKALCEPVALPRDTQNYLHYFCTTDTTDQDTLAHNEPKRVALYQAIAALIRAYAQIANELEAAEAVKIKAEVTHYTKMRDEVKYASGDYLDMKRYEPAMRHLLDSYIRADESTIVSKFEDLGLVELIVKQGIGALDALPAGLKEPTAMAETIENNIRRTIIDENPVNPKYYDQMSNLLDALILERRKQAISYQDYLEKVKQLAQQVNQPGTKCQNYPASLDTPAKRSLYDNLGQDEALALQIDTAVRVTKKEGWINHRFKQREVANAIRTAIADRNINVTEVLELVKNQREYQ
ncbi:type I restriction endonuclease subunit R [Leptolyngbya sp. NIES-2104]|uniref:type I restriction endonuclease subunit R n=1 Tax=Leptolyngbya sp. NIES-2104 TaxID=1552121 RepID=UPI0006ECA603|nr:HsdR family type I site-specific deoxyribonuclease [Leptolyngbya sp. NIES-2104]GAP99873.1 type I restriction-modification system, restriction subunit R [Leptolyngbya sp. NIES-2104]